VGIITYFYKQHSVTSGLGFQNVRTCTSIYIFQLTDSHQGMWKSLRQPRPHIQQLIAQGWISI
jgi:hypothetical protein